MKGFWPRRSSLRSGLGCQGNRGTWTEAWQVRSFGSASEGLHGDQMVVAEIPEGPRFCVNCGASSG